MEVIWTKSKRIAVFSQETFPYSERELWKSSLILQVGVCFCRKHNVSCFYLVTCVGGISWRVLRNFWNQDHSERVTSFEQWAERGRTLPHQARIELSDFHARVWKYDQGGRNSMQEMHGNQTKCMEFQPIKENSNFWTSIFCPGINFSSSKSLWIWWTIDTLILACLKLTTYASISTKQLLAALMDGIPCTKTEKT